MVSGALTLLVVPVIYLVFNPPERDEPPASAELMDKVRRTSTRFYRRERPAEGEKPAFE